ncbi:hypothetical protein IAR50_004116 [Cryptococcus sp. DSM 104548]
MIDSPPTPWISKSIMACLRTLTVAWLLMGEDLRVDFDPEPWRLDHLQAGSWRLIHKTAQGVPVPPMSPQELAKVEVDLLKMTTLYPTDLRAMDELLLELGYVQERPYGSWDIVSGPSKLRHVVLFVFSTGRPERHHAMLLAFMYSGSRRGSLLTTHHWPDLFAQWKDVLFRPVRWEDGQIIGFDFLLTVKKLKGYSSGRDLRVNLRFKGVQSPNHLVIGLPTFLLAHGLHRGVFGNCDLDDVLKKEEYIPKCDPAFDDAPIFKSRGSKSTLKSSPMRS